VGGRLFRYWTFDATTQYNPRDQRWQRYTVGTRYAPEAGKVVNLSYRFNRDPASPLKQVDVSGSGRSRRAGTPSGGTITRFWTSACWRAWPASSTTPAAGRFAQSCSASRPRHR